MNANRFITAVFVATLLSTSLQAARFDDAQRAEVQRAGLVEMDSRYFDEVYGQALGQLGEVKNIYIADLKTREVQFNEPERQGLHRGRDWYLNDADHEWLNAQYRESLIEAIEAVGGYQIVAEPGNNTLTINARLVELSPLAPRDDGRSRSAFSEYYSEGTGAMTIAIEIGHDGETQLALIDERQAGWQWERNDAFHSRRNVIRVFDRWARNLVALVATQ